MEIIISTIIGKYRYMMYTKVPKYYNIYKSHLGIGRSYASYSTVVKNLLFFSSFVAFEMREQWVHRCAHKKGFASLIIVIIK